MNILISHIKYISLISLLLISSIVFAVGGSTVGNGGDLVQCKSLSAGETFVYKSLDYLLTIDKNDDSDLIVAKNLFESLHQIQNLIDEKFPELSLSFQGFVRTLWNSDVREGRIWEPSPFGVLPVTDEEIGSGHLLPQECRDSSDKALGDGNNNGNIKVNENRSKINLVQAIVRLREKFNPDQPKIVYTYMSDLVKSVEKSDPIQISFLLVHEWLWDYSKNVERNRRINRLFHSKSFHKMSAESARNMLSSLGFIFPDADSQYFDGEFCQSTPSSINELMIKRRGALLGLFKTMKRVRFCSKMSGCDSYKISSLEGDPTLEGTVGLSLNIESAVMLHSNQAVGRYMPNSTCLFSEEGKVSCSSLLTQYGPYRFNGKEIKFTGNISSECMHLKFRIQTPQFNESWTEAEFSLLGQFK